MADPQVTLTIASVAVRRRGLLGGRQELWIEYELANQSGQPVYVLNLMRDHSEELRPPPREELSPEPAQTCHAGGGVVHFLHGTVPQPFSEPGMTFFAPITPHASLVKDRARLRATIRAPLPLVEWTVYEPPVREGEGIERVAVHTARLSVEYLLDGDKTYAGEDEDVPGAFQVSGHPMHRAQATARLPETCELLARQAFPVF